MSANIKECVGCIYKMFYLRNKHMQYKKDLPASQVDDDTV